MNNSDFYRLKITQIKAETDTALCLSFAVPSELQERFNFIQGQYLTLRTELDGAEIRRSYSICSGVDDNRLQVAIKAIEGGLFSEYAHRELKVGDSIDVMPPKGDFHTALHSDNQKNYMCICAGSGITPILSLLKSILSREPNSQVCLLFGNQNSATIMFKDELGFLKNRYMDRFSWINILSREEQDTDILFGRITNKKGAQLQARHLIDIAATDEFFLCGPEAMISGVSRGLRDFGVDETHIHYELFYASAEDAQTVIDKHHSRAVNYAGQQSEVSVTVGGRSMRFDLAADGENILDAALNSGADLPFSCKGGVCATCKARLIEGQVDMDLNHALSDKELEQGFILTCQSHPVSDRVVVDFD